MQLQFVTLCAFSFLNFARTVIAPEPYQIFSESTRIYKLTANGRIVVIDDNNHVTSIDYHYRRNEIYWVSDNSIRTAPLDTVEGVATDYPPLASGMQINSISVDWRANKLYWTDSIAHTIEEYNIVSSRRTIVYQTTVDSTPSGIVVDPFTAWLYWTDGQQGTVERIRVNGTTHRVIRVQASRVGCTTSVSWPIALNHSSQHLYWSDSCVNQLERVTVGGFIANTVYTGLSFASSISSYTSTLWWAQPRVISRIDMGGTGLVTVYRTAGLSKLYSVRTVHPSNQPDDLLVPDCSPSCVHGFCADPVANVCDCTGTGWTGPRCDLVLQNSTSLETLFPLTTITISTLMQPSAFSSVTSIAMNSFTGVSSSPSPKQSTLISTLKSTNLIFTPKPTNTQPVTSALVVSSAQNSQLGTSSRLPSLTPGLVRSTLAPHTSTTVYVSLFTESVYDVSQRVVSSTTTEVLSQITKKTHLWSITSLSSNLPLLSVQTTPYAIPIPTTLHTTSPLPAQPTSPSVLGSTDASSEIFIVKSSSFNSVPDEAVSETSFSSYLHPSSKPSVLTSSLSVQLYETFQTQHSVSPTSYISLATTLQQLPIKPEEKELSSVPTYALVVAILVGVLLLAATITLVAAAMLYFKHIKMKYAEHNRVFGDLFPSNKVVNNPLYIGIRTVEHLAEEQDNKPHHSHFSTPVRDDISIAQCSSSGSEVSVRSDDPIVALSV